MARSRDSSVEWSGYAKTSRKMSTSAQGKVVDAASGAAIGGVTVVLEDVSSVFPAILMRKKTDSTGAFASDPYPETNQPGSIGPRRVRLTVGVGKHIIHSEQLDDVSAAQWNIPTLKVNGTDATSWLATLNTGAVSRRTDGNAVRWLVDDEMAWSELAKAIDGAQKNVNMMQLALDIDTYKQNADDENPSVVLAFNPANLSAQNRRKLTAADTRIERKLLEVARRPSVQLRLQIAGIRVSSQRFPTPSGLGLLELLEYPFTVILWLFAQLFGLIAPHWVNNRIGDPDAVAAWFSDAGQPNVAKAFPAPPGSAIHAKIVTIDDTTGVLLGSPFIQGYYSSQTHAIDDPRRGKTAAAEKGPIHDVSAIIRGPAAGHLQEVFNLHWNISDPSAHLPVPPPSPAPVTPDAGKNEFDASVQIVRTLDEGVFPALPDGEKGALEAYLRAIGLAERFIYCENQYFTEDVIIDALIEAMLSNPNLEVILVINVHPDIPCYTGWQAKGIRKIVDAIADAAKRFAAFTTWSYQPPSADPPHPKASLCLNYVHAKVAVVDNKWATVGSTNLDGASLTNFQFLRGLIHAMLGGGVRNSESNCVVYEATPPAQSAVDALRRTLWAEHLGMKPDDLADQPGKTWVETWSNTAKAKLHDLSKPAHILPWAINNDSTEAKDYITSLYQANGLPIPDVDLVPQGPLSFDFKSGAWLKGT